MIDRTAREEFARHLRQLITGRISNDRFEDGVPSTGDRAVERIFEDLAYPLYSDTHEHRLIGRDNPTEKARDLTARAVLFLHTRFEYEWPNYPLHVNWLVYFEPWRRKAERDRRAFEAAGDIKVWPFIRHEDFEQAKMMPVYLGGKVKDLCDDK